MALGTPTDGGAAYSAAGGGGTTVTPAYPAGIQADDVLVLIVGMKPSTANGGTIGTAGAISGWTQREAITAQGGYGTTLGADTGNTNLWIYTKDTVDGTETGNLTVTVGTNNVCWGIIVRVPGGGGTSFSYGTADGSRATAPTSGTAFTTLLTNGTTAPNLQAGDIAIWAMCIPTDVLNNGFTAPTITSTGTTFGTAVELEEPDSGNGNDIGGYVAYASATSGSSTAAPTVGVTATGTVTNVRGPIALIRIRDTSQPLTPSLYTNDQTFHNPTVTVGAVTLTPDLYTNDQTFYSPDVTQTGGTQDLTPALYTNDQTFYQPTVTASYALEPARYDNAQTFYQPAVTTSVTLQASLYTNDQTFYGPVITQTGGAQTLLPDLYTNGQTFYQPTVTPGAVTLQPALYTNDQTFYQPAITTTVELTPARYDNAQTFFTPTVSQGADVLFPQLVTNNQTFYSPTVTPGAVTLAPQDYVDPNYVDPNYIGPNTFSTQVFYSPTVTPGAVTIAPPLFTNSSTFFAPTVQLESIVITRAQALELYKIYLLHGLGASPLVVSSNGRSAGAVQQSVAQSGSTVTISTTAAPAFIVGNTGTQIEELAALHGLTADLVTTATSRTAGSISQSFATSGATTTVTRQ